MIAPTRRRAQGRWWLAAWVVGALLLVPVAYAVSGRPDAGPSTTAGDPIGVPQVIAPASRSAASLSGSQLGSGSSRLGTDSMRGSVVVVNIWAAWCPPCKEELPALAGLATQFSPRGVRFIGLDVKDDASQALALTASLHVPYPSIADADGTRLDTLSRFVPSYAIPSTLVLDRQGRVALTVIGPVDAKTFGTALADVVAE